MEWIQPSLFWAAAGIAIPVAIHLWNGRKGKVIAWAATAWLNTKESQSSRSFKLEHWWLLLVRVLLWILLVLLAVGLWWRSSEQSGSPQIAHVLVPNPQVEAEFRFELEQALSRGEEVFWLAEGLPAYESGENASADFDAREIQAYLDLLPKGLDSLHLYSAGFQSEFASSIIWISTVPNIHLAREISKPPVSDRLIQLPTGGFLGLDESGSLEIISSETAAAAEKIAFSGAIPVHVAVKDERKAGEIKASLTALEEVYGLSFEEADMPVSKVVFSDQFAENGDSGKLYFQTEAVVASKQDAVVPLNLSISLPWDEAVEKGVLPELILAPLIEFLGISSTDTRLSQTQLAQRFVEIPKAKQAAAANTTEIFLVLIVLCFGLERFLAYRSNL